MINTASDNGAAYVNKTGDSDKSITLIRFMWMPGVRPVNTPNDIPKRIASKIFD